MPETITVPIPASAIDAALRERIVSLEDERDAALAVVGPLDGETLAEAVSRIRFHRIAELTRERDEAKSRMFALTTERDEEKARRLEADRELELARVEAEAKPNQSAWEAACMLRKERDEAKSMAQGEVTRASRLAIEVNTLRRQLDEMRQERDAACDALIRTGRDLSAAAEMRDKYSFRIATLESAIRNLAKVLP